MKAPFDVSSLDGSLELKRCSVLLTRPALQSNNIANMIEAKGGQVVHLPLLEIEPVCKPEDIERVKSYVLGLDQYDIAIFISTNAARLGMGWISNYWPQLPMGLEAFAVGPSTAELLQEESWHVHVSPSGVTSEDLLALEPLQDMQGKRVALFRGKGGRELIAQTLRERGAVVDYIEVYERLVPEYEQELMLEEIETKHVNCVVLTSMQTLLSFMKLLGLGAEHKPVEDEMIAWFQETLILIVPSERVREFALEKGFKHVVNAGGAGDELILKSLQALQFNSEDM